MTDHFPGAGSRIEALRRAYRTPAGERITQTALAELAGISRQTLSVAVNADRLTGKTARKLAAILGSSEDAVLYGESSSGQWEPTPDSEIHASAEGIELEEFVSNMDRIVLTLRNFPGGELGVRIKIGFLNLVEDVARETGNKLPLEYYRIRKEVQDGER